MNEPSAIRVVCFDLGGVVIRICRTWEEGAAAAGLPVRDGLNARLQTNLKSVQTLVVEHQTGRMAGHRYFAAFSELLDGLYSPTEVERVHQAWMFDEYEGVGSVIEELNQAGIVTAALSNTNESHWMQLDAYSAFRSITHRFASHIIGHHKPDSGAYAHVESALDAPADSILFFDDLEENVNAARSRGWHAAHIDHAGRPAAQMNRVLVQLGLTTVRRSS